MERTGVISQEAKIRGVVVIRDIFEEGFTSGNDEFWIGLEKKSVNLRADEQSLRDACFEYWFEKHLLPDQAARMLLDLIPKYRGEKRARNINEKQDEDFVNRLAGKLFDFYPENVKEMLSRRALKNDAS